MVAENSEAEKELGNVPVFSSPDEELAFWCKHDPWKFPDYWEEAEIWMKHRSFGWVKEDGRLLEP